MRTEFIDLEREVTAVTVSSSTGIVYVLYRIRVIIRLVSGVVSVCEKLIISYSVRIISSSYNQCISINVKVMMIRIEISLSRYLSDGVTCNQITTKTLEAF